MEDNYVMAYLNIHTAEKDFSLCYDAMKKLRYCLIKFPESYDIFIEL